eukprot:PLAT11710.1.p1 GENE.PLAT11710.1~~PLAT11710.1.p1  ORF type:complete len:294 (+),score=112.25 PLAT11710.1:71-883(+)
MSAWEDAAEGRGKRRSKSVAVDRIAHSIGALEGHVDKLKQFLEQLGTAEDTPATRRRLKQERLQAASVVKRTAKALLDAGDRVKEEPLASQHKDFQKLMAEYAEVNEATIKREKELTRIMSEQVKSGDFGSRSVEMGSVLSDAASSEVVITFEQFGEVDLDLVRERQEETAALAAEAAELHKLFKDVSALVSEQSEQLVVMEDNVTAASSAVKEGTKEVEESLRLQRKARNKKCALIVCLVVILIVILGGAGVFNGILGGGSGDGGGSGS